MSKFPSSTELEARIRSREAQLKSVREQAKPLLDQGKGLEDPTVKRLAAEATYLSSRIESDKSLLTQVKNYEKLTGTAAPNDAISTALRNQTTTVQSTISNTTTSAQTAAQGAIDNATASAQAVAQSAIDDLKSKLPIQKDPRLLAREKEAEILRKKAEIERLAIEKKDEIIAKIKAKLGSLGIPSLPIPPKLPLLDPKILQALALAKQLKSLIAQKQKQTQDTLKKAQKTYEYPLTPDGVKSKIAQQTQNLPLKPQIVPQTTTTPLPTPTPTPTRPIRSKFTFSLDGGVTRAFELVTVRYDYTPLKISAWPILYKFVPDFSYQNYPLGVQSVRAYIQDEINRGVFDKFVEPPY